MARKPPSKQTQIKMVRGALKSPKTPKQFLPSLRKRLAKLLAVVLFVVALAVPARAQFIGFTSPQTVQQNLTGVLTACTGAGQNFVVQNLGQTQHYATVSPTIFTTNMTMVILGKDALGNTITISDTAFIPTTSPNIFSVTASGYYPVVIVQVTCSGGSFALAYSGTSATPYVNAGTYLASQIDKAVFVSASSGSNQTSVTFVPPFAVSFGKIVFQYHIAGIAGSSMVVTCGTNGTNNNYETWSFDLANSTALQVFQIPNFECARVSVAYVAGGASANTFSVDYLLNNPGENISSNSYTHITGTTATVVKAGPGIVHSVVVGTPAAGTISLFDLVSGSCTGTPVTNIVSVITATVTFPSAPEIYDTLFNNGICVKASAGMDITVSAQ